jgi:hypothetical protein
MAENFNMADFLHKINDFLVAEPLNEMFRHFDFSELVSIFLTIEECWKYNISKIKNISFSVYATKKS